MMNINKPYEKNETSLHGEVRGNETSRPFYNNARYMEHLRRAKPEENDRRSDVYERIPRGAIERCYVTEFLKEVNYLTDRGIRPVQSIVKREWGIRQYKYVKTPALFAALHEFWKQESAEREFRRVDRDIDRATSSPEWAQRSVR